MKPKITHVLLDEKDILDLICEKHNIRREKASMNINYVEDNHEIPGSWIIQVQAPEKKIEKKSKKLELSLSKKAD